MNFIEAGSIGVNYSDFSENVFLSHDYINPVINLSHVMNFHQGIYNYQHNINNHSNSQRVKFSIVFNFNNGAVINWQFDSRDVMEKEFKRISRVAANTFSKLG